MTEYKIEPWYVWIIKEIFRNRVFRVDINDKYNCMPRGVCQGSALGPLLFCSYINSVGSCFSSPFLLYADDLVLFDSGIDEVAIINSLLTHIEKMCDWCEANGVNMNFEKTNFMIFHKERDMSSKSISVDKIKLRYYCIDRVFSFKYLGLWFDPHLSFNVHYNAVSRKVVARIKYLRGVKRYLTPHIIKIMRNAYVHSVIDDGLEIWVVQTNSELEKLQCRINRFLLEFFCPSHLKKRRKLYFFRILRAVLRPVTRYVQLGKLNRVVHHQRVRVVPTKDEVLRRVRQIVNCVTLIELITALDHHGADLCVVGKCLERRTPWRKRGPASACREWFLIIIIVKDEVGS
jgi:hypothetical protein